MSHCSSRLEEEGEEHARRHHICVEHIVLTDSAGNVGEALLDGHQDSGCGGMARDWRSKQGHATS
eukprot:8756187-Alexandrium_andersonii.AAC.2